MFYPLIGVTVFLANGNPAHNLGGFRPKGRRRSG